MKYSLFIIPLLLLLIVFGSIDMAFAVCDENPPNRYTCDTNPPNPDPNGIQRGGTQPNIFVEVLTGAGIDAPDICIRLGSGNDDVNIGGGFLTCIGRCINTRNGSDEVEVIDSELTCGERGINTGFMMDQDINDNVKVIGSTIDAGTLANEAAIRTGGGDDVIEIAHSVLDATDPDGVVQGRRGNDTVILGTGAVINGLINADGGQQGNDTLVFNMEVIPSLINKLCAEIATLEPQDDSIVINDIEYEWVNFELLVCDLQPLTKNVPTLSEWGLISLAGILGLIGLLVIRRRKATA